MWLIIAAVMHGLSAFFDGRGEFRRTFEFSGYGFLPSLLGSAFTIPVSLKYVEGAAIQKIDVQELAANPEILVRSLVSHFPDGYVYSTIFLNLELAMVCVAIPTAIFGLFQVTALMRLL